MIPSRTAMLFGRGEIMTYLRLPNSLLAVAVLLPLAACNPGKKDTTGTESAAAATATATVASDSSKETSAAPVADFKSVARRVVTQSAGVGEGDIVMLTGDVADLPLLEDMAVEVMKAGGEPLFRLGRRSLPGEATMRSQPSTTRRSRAWGRS